MTNSVESLTKDLKDILLKTKQELKNKDDYIKKQKTVQDLSKKTKKEYQILYKEYTSVKKQLQQYDAYMKTQRLEKRRKEKNELEKQKMEFERRKNEQENEISMLNEFKKLNMLNEIKSKNKKHNRKYDESEEEEEKEEEDKPPKKRKKRKKTTVLDLINE